MLVQKESSVFLNAGRAERVWYWFLWAGIIGPILFVIVFTIDGFLKPGYSVAAEAISYLEVGANGWIQQLNFILLGLLLFVFLIGYAQRMRPVLGRGWLYASCIFLVLSDLGWILSGLCVPAPFLKPQFGWPAILHQIAFDIVFLPLTIAWLILGLKCIFTARWRLYGVYSVIIGVPLCAFTGISIIHLIDPRLVAGIVGDVNEPHGGIVNRVMLLIAPIAWYILSAFVVMFHVDQRSKRAKEVEETRLATSRV